MAKARARNKENWGILFWDILFWVSVILPFATGGIWIDKPGFRLELAQINLQVVFLGLFALYMHYFLHWKILQATSLRCLSKVWEKWRECLERFPRRTLWLAVIILTFFWAGAAISRHSGFHSGAADMGIFTNALWNLINGNGFISSLRGGVNLLTDHQSPILILLAPIFYLWPEPETLLVVQAFGLLCGGIALYYIGKQYLPQGNIFLPLLPICYWFYFPLRNVNRFEFHPEVFMLPLFLAAIWGLQSTTIKKRLLGLIFLLLALSAKESAGPIAVGIGIAWLFGAAPENTRRFTRKISLILIPFAILLFMFDTSVVPQLFGREYIYNDVYKHLGNNLWEIAAAPILKPKYFFTHLVSGGRLTVFLGALLPLLFLPPLGWRAFFASVPGFLMIFLTEGEHRITLGYHYNIEFSTGIFWALPFALQRIRQSFTLPYWDRVQRSWQKYKFTLTKLSPNVLLILLCIALFGTYGRSDLYYMRSYTLSPHKQWIKKSVLPCLSPLSISVPSAISPHLAARTWVSFTPIIELGIGSRYTVACVITDREFALKPHDEESLLNNLARLKYFELYSCDGLKIYQASADRMRCLRCIPECKN